MKLSITESVTTEDIPAVSLGLYHAAKIKAAGGLAPINAVEFTLTERTNDAFRVYLASIRKSVLRLTEKV